MLIRSATVEDAPAISALVTACAREHIASSLSDAGLSRLLSEMTTENQAKRIRNGYQFFVALESDKLVGTAAIRLPSHLYYLFVDTQHQRARSVVSSGIMLVTGLFRLPITDQLQ